MKPIKFRHFQHVVIAACTIVLVYSCDLGNKGDDKPARDPRLKEMRAYYQGDFVPTVDSTVLIFEYNANNLLSRMYDTASSIDYAYNDKGQLIQTDYSGESGDEFLWNYNWSGNTVTVTDTAYGYGKIIYTLNREGKISRMDAFVLESGQWVQEYYYLYDWSGQNLATSELWDRAGKQGIGGCNHLLPSDKVHAALCPGFRKTEGGNDKTGFYRSEVIEYIYDDKKNPFKDFQVYWFSEVCYYASANNAVSYTITVFRTNGEVDGTYQVDYDFFYHQNGYPEKKDEIHDLWSSRESYFYE